MRKTDQGQTEQDTSSHDLPPVAEVRELVTVHLAVLGEKLADTLEDGHDDHDDCHEEDEEDQTGQENIGLFNTGFESYTFDTTDGGGLLSGLLRLSLSLEQRLGGTLHESQGRVNGTLEHLDGCGGQFRENGRWGASRRALIPGADGLQEAHTDDTHTPLEVLRPRFDNRRHMDRHHAEQGLRLHEAEERQGIGRHVSSGVGMSETGCNGRRG